LFEEARTLINAGHAKEACPKLEESQALDPGTGTLLNLARCYELTNRLASAWSRYLEAAASAKAQGSAKREREARKRAQALVPRLSHLVVNVAPETRALPGLQVTRDGQPVGAAQWGQPIAADEGEHQIEARAEGYRTWQTAIAVSGEGKTQTVSVPGLEREAAKPEPESAVVTPSLTPAPAEPIRDERSGLGTQRTLALVVGGVGVVGLGVGTVFGLKSKSKHDEAEDYCDGADCTDARGVSAGEDAYSAGNVATVAMALGALGVAGGITLWLTAPSPSAQRATQVGLGAGSVHFRSTW
jgi:serine/threonine-protein kinase